MGHVVPGTFFTLFSLWWLYNVLYKYFYARRFRPLSYKNTSCFPCACGRNFPLESCLKVIAVVIGMIGEFATGFEDGHFTHIGNAQHMTMFFFFGINGLVDICYYKKWPLPPQLDYATAALAFSVEGFLFFNHLHGRPHMDIQVHMFLFYVITACVIFTVLEMSYPKNVLAALGRIFFTLLQGTWFYQVGFILYPPIGEKWDVDSHPQMMVVTLMFTWHMAALVALMGTLGVLIYIRVQNVQGPGPAYQMVETQEDGLIEKETLSTRYPYGHTNGHLKSQNGSIPVHHLLDSESEEA